MKALIISLIPLCLFFGACECLDNEYAFREAVNFFPENKIISLGDTIWLNSKFSCEDMLNINTGKKESLCDMPNLESYFSIIKFDPDSTKPLAAISLVNIYDSIGNSYTADAIKPDLVKQIQFFGNGAHYEVLIGICPHEEGKYGIYIGNGIANIREVRKSKCENRADFIFEIGNGDRHLEIFHEYWGDQQMSSAIIDRYYCFEVVN